MEAFSAWRESLGALAAQVGEHLARLLPSLVGAILLLVIGWLAARLLRALTVRLAQMLEATIQRLYQHRGVTLATSALASGRVLGELVFWVVILFFLTAAMHVLGIETFTVWVNRVLAYLPTLVVGALIIIAGFLLSSLARDLVVAAAPLETASRRLLGRAAQAIILVTAIVIGADQIGINITFLVILTAVALAALLGGVALALSLGARVYVANLIGARYLRDTYRVGQRVRIGEHEGRVLEFTPTAIVLETAAGRATLPGKIFHEVPSVLVVEPGETHAQQ
jgi:small-conductance mechanosensitive channel